MSFLSFLKSITPILIKSFKTLFKLCLVILSFFKSSEIVMPSYKEIRLITVPRVASKLPSNNFEGKWEVSNPEGVRKFSAVAYSFALLINKTLDVPVGIIHNSWGGTPAEAWTEKSFLENNFEEGVIKNNRDDKRLSHEPSYLFNGMINPIFI